jgi:hypothetical protein
MVVGSSNEKKGIRKVIELVDDASIVSARGENKVRAIM